MSRFVAVFLLFVFILFQFKSDTGRLAYLKSNGLSHLFESCKYCTSIDLTSCSEEEKKSRINLITVILGCLHNVTNENGMLLSYLKFSFEFYYCILIIGMYEKRSQIKLNLNTF